MGSRHLTEDEAGGQALEGPGSKELEIQPTERTCSLSDSNLCFSRDKRNCYSSKVAPWRIPSRAHLAHLSLRLEISERINGGPWEAVHKPGGTASRICLQRGFLSWAGKQGWRYRQGRTAPRDQATQKVSSNTLFQLVVVVVVSFF